MALDHRPLLLCVVCIAQIMINSTKMSDGFLSGASSKLYGVVEPSYSILTEGSTLVINCTLTTYALTNLRSEALYFTSKYLNNLTRVNDTYYHIVNQSTMEMVIPDVKREDGTTFKCYIEDSDITGESFDSLVNEASADIGEAPYPFRNISIVSENFVNMTVDWCPEVYQEDPVASTLFWQIENTGTPPALSGNCTTWTNSRQCACVFCGSPASGVCVNKEPTFSRYQNYLFNITSTNLYGRIDTYKEVYTSPKIVKPGPVTNLKVEPISGRELSVSWGSPDTIDTTIVLYYQISASSKYGENLLIDVGANKFWTLTNLTPHTNYTVAVRCKPVEEGYWSNDCTAYGVTLEEAPEVAPNVPIGFFRLSECSSDKCSITVFWQLIDERLQNGEVLGYRISVESAHCSPCQELYVSGGSKTSATISFASDFDFWVGLVARTSVGDSPPRFIYFPSYLKRLPNIFNQDLYAEYTMDGTGVFFNWNYIEDIENYTFMYCQGIESDLNNCQDSPKDIFLSDHETNFTFNSTDKKLVYSLSANYRNGTNGLTAQWICKYDYLGGPGTPNLRSPVQMSDTSIKISWDALQCSIVNRGRVVQYVLSYIPNTTAIDTGGSIQLPGNITEHVVTGLSPQTLYILTLYAVSRGGPGQNATQDIQTVLPKTNNITAVAVGSTIAALVAMGLIVAGIVFVVRRCRRWCKIDINPPKKHESPNIPPIDSSATSGNYATVMENSDSQSGVNYSSSNSSDAPILQLSCSENENSEGSTETSAVSDSIQTYTAIVNDESSTETAGPNCHSTSQCSDSNQPQSFLLDMESADSCDSFGYSQGKCTDSKNDSNVLYNNSSHQSRTSVASSDSFDSSDGYKKTELRDCVGVELTGPPIQPVMLEI